MSVLMELAEKIKENKKIHYILKMIKHLGDEEYMEFFLNREIDPLLLEFKKKGEYPYKKRILLITENGKGWGFFAEFRAMLAKMLFAERFLLEPYIYWGESFLYAESEIVCGTANAFEYYFRQPLDISIENGEGCYFTVSKSAQAEMIEKEFKKHEYDITQEYLKALAGVYKKYVRLNENTERCMKKEIEDLLQGKRTLAVHYRGTDYKVGYDIHPIGVRIEQEIEAVQRILEEGEIEQIFLATDEIEAVDQFQNVFGERLVYFCDVYRGNSQISVAFSQSERKNHHYRLGYEVLRDMYALSACEGMVAGLSQVVTCARIVKESGGSIFNPMVIINNGIHHNNIKFHDKRERV